MKKIRMFCISLEPNHYKFIKDLGYTPVGLGEKIFDDNWLSDKPGLNISRKNKHYGEGSKNKPGFPKQPKWFEDARGFENLEIGLKKVGFSMDETNGILGNNWFNFYKDI